MRENKVSCILIRIFSLAFVFCIGGLFTSVLILGYTIGKIEYSEKSKLAIIIAFVLMSAIAVTAVYFLQNKSNRIRKRITLSDKSVKRIIFLVCFILLLVQLFAGYKLRIIPDIMLDLKKVNACSMYYAEHGDFQSLFEKSVSDQNYMARYPNNHGILLLLSLTFRGSYLLLGYVPEYLPIAINCLAINLSVLFTVLTAQKIFGNKRALIVLVMCCMFVPYYTYTPFYYTDTLSMPFLAGGLLLFASALKSESFKKSLLFMLFAGVVILAGYKIKASVVFLLPCIVVYVILKLDIKKVLCLGLALLVGFGSLYVAYKPFANSFNICTEEQLYENQYPYTHWVMMGLKGYGYFNHTDGDFTTSLPNIDEKTKGNIEVIKTRLAEYGVSGLAKHLIEKAVNTWQDGTYFITKYLSIYVSKSVLHEILVEKGKKNLLYSIYCCGYQLMLIFMMLMSAVRFIRRPRADFTVLLMGLVFAIFVFLLIWESRSRYLYNFTPVFILLASCGLDTSVGAFKNFTEKIKQRHVGKNSHDVFLYI